MRQLFIYLFIYLLLNACGGVQNYLIRESVNGLVFNSLTNKPIDSVSTAFFLFIKDPNNSNLDKTFYSNKKGHFIIPEIRRKTHYQGAQLLRLSSSHYLKIFKKGFITDTIYIRDSIYRLDKEKNIVFLDTIYLEPIKK